MPRPTTTQIGFLFIFLSSLTYSLFGVFVKFIYQHSEIDSLSLAFWRFVIAFVFLWTLALGLWERFIPFESPPAGSKPVRVPLILLGTLVAAASLTAMYGLRGMDAGLYTLIFFSYPAMVLLISRVLGERIPLRGWAALALTTGGLVLVTPPIQAGSNVTGVILALVNALVIAVFIVGNVRVQRRVKVSSPRLLGWVMTGTLLTITPIALWNGVYWPESWVVWGLIAGLAVVSTVVPYFAIMLGGRLLGASRSALVGTLEPVITLIFAWTLLHERLTAPQLYGSVLIVGSLVLLELRLPRRKAVQAKPIISG
jgi:drug/metabolite transporter (DMT)-like permease